MSKFAYWHEGLIFIIVFLIVMAIPCAAIAYFGSKLIAELGQYPSKSAKIQLSMALPLLGTMILSFGIFAVFFHIFSD